MYQARSAKRARFSGPASQSVRFGVNPCAQRSTRNVVPFRLRETPRYRTPTAPFTDSISFAES